MSDRPLDGEPDRGWLPESCADREDRPEESARRILRPRPASVGPRWPSPPVHPDALASEHPLERRGARARSRWSGNEPPEKLHVPRWLGRRRSAWLKSCPFPSSRKSNRNPATIRWCVREKCPNQPLQKGVSATDSARFY